jgi:hypothetical protein
MLLTLVLLLLLLLLVLVLLLLPGATPTWNTSRRLSPTTVLLTCPWRQSGQVRQRPYCRFWTLLCHY